MFKNKKAVYILIPLNIAIWGYFGYRFYTMYTGGDAPAMTEKTSTLKLKDLTDSVSYKLNLNYKDPFLRETEKQKNYHAENSPNNAVKQQQHERTKAVKIPSVTIAPKPPLDLKYFGLVKNSTTGTATALVTLNGQSKLIKVNDILEGITFKSFNKDSLVAKSGKETIVVRK